jgi:hypothetical protein
LHEKIAAMLYQVLIICHSITRWLVLASLVYAIYRAYKGYSSNVVFSKTDDTVRHSTATVSHIQLMIGFVLYFQSPIVKYLWQNFKVASGSLDTAFFGIIHITLMFISIMVISIGSSLSKREKEDRKKFRIMLVYFSIALFLIFLAIPWPFSPLSSRPYLRLF